MDCSSGKATPTWTCQPHRSSRPHMILQVLARSTGHVDDAARWGYHTLYTGQVPVLTPTSCCKPSMISLCPLPSPRKDPLASAGCEYRRRAEWPCALGSGKLVAFSIHLLRCAFRHFKKGDIRGPWKGERLHGSGHGCQEQNRRKEETMGGGQGYVVLMDDKVASDGIDTWRWWLLKQPKQAR